MRLTVIGSSAILFAWTAAFAMSAVGADTAISTPERTLALDRTTTSGWKVGYAEADITPAPGEAMLAGFGQPRQVTGTLAPLRAQALAFEDGNGRRALLITADVLGFGRASVDVLRRRRGIRDEEGTRPGRGRMAGTEGRHRGKPPTSIGPPSGSGLSRAARLKDGQGTAS